MAGLILAPLCFYAANWMFKRFGILQLAVPLPPGWSERLAHRRVFQTATDATERTKERG